VTPLAVGLTLLCNRKFSAVSLRFFPFCTLLCISFKSCCPLKRMDWRKGTTICLSSSRLHMILRVWTLSIYDMHGL
jgi:hypothetical protein